MAFAVPPLHALSADKRLMLVLAGTPAERQSGRGLKVRPSAFAKACDELGISCERFANSHQLEQALVKAKVDFAVVCAFGMKLSAESLAAPSHGCINIHASLLPRWRGAAPIERAILAGDEQTGVSLIQMTEKMDHGPVLRCSSIPIEKDDTAGKLHGKLAELGAKLIVPTVVDHAQLTATSQNDSLATLARKLTKDEAKLDWTEPADILLRKVRAFNPRPGAYTHFRGKRVKVLDARLADKDGVPGTVLAVDKNLLCIGCGSKSLELDRVVPAGSKPMNIDAWLVGLQEKLELNQSLDN